MYVSLNKINFCKSITMIRWLRHRWTSLCLLVLALGAFILFLYGFFPLKYHSGKMANMDDLPNVIDGVSIDGQLVYNSGQNTVILMVIDGLRYDFVTEEYMPFTGQLIKNKSACIYVSVAEPPTVTMPRIKSPERKKEKAQWRRTINFWRDIFAMMTGSVSTFADVALNFGAPAVKGDSVLRVAAARGRKSMLYGDDTWLRLFPDLWTEYEGTTSFFVSDYTEVDSNVTRNLIRILTPGKKRIPKFDFLVLHYLGLDHIGHLEGARSPKIKPKLLEMDGVIKKIFSDMQKWDRTGVLFICGDHGMRDAGGHGGATPAEVLVPLVLLKTNDFLCPHDMKDGGGPTVAQVDLAPSVAWLLNAPIPGDSTGRILPALLPTDTRQHLYLLHVIAQHNAEENGLPTDTEFYKQFRRAEKQFAHYLATGQQSAAKIAKEFYEESLEIMSKYLAESAVDFDMFSIGVAICLLYCVLGSLACIALYSFQPDIFRKLTVPHHKKSSTAGVLLAYFIIYAISCSVLTTACFITETKSQLCSFDELWLIAFLLIACAFTMSYFLIKSGIEKIDNLTTLKELNAIDYLLIFGTLFHPWTFFGTSFIEEEHLTWYFFWNTLMFFVLIRMIMLVVIYLSKKFFGATEVQEKPQLEQKINAVRLKIVPQWIFLIALHRYLRTMNQTGDRWLFLPDTADWLNAPGHELFLELQLAIGIMCTLDICLSNVKYMNDFMLIHSILTILATFIIFAYRIVTGALDLPFAFADTWDTVSMVNIFWCILLTQFVFEILTYVGLFRSCGGVVIPNRISNYEFVFNKTKAKTEDYYYDPSIEEPWNIAEVKLNLARSLSHIMLNHLMLTVVMLMRPHNVIMVPSIYLTCSLTSKCLDHKLLDTSSTKRTDIVDVISQALVHIWIGHLFFFYQGNSNSLASVDLDAGYVGLSEYCPARVATRMGLHAYAGPAIAGATLFCYIANTSETWQQYLQTIWRTINIFALQQVFAITIYSVVAAVFRHHLFVWTVFSPKLLYDFVATVLAVQALGTIAEIIWLTHITCWLARLFANKTRL